MYVNISVSSDYSVPQKISMSKKSCRTCEIEETMKIDLISRKECTNLKKVSLSQCILDI